jgi:hypothetical protein
MSIKCETILHKRATELFHLHVSIANPRISRKEIERGAINAILQFAREMDGDNGKPK